MHVCIHACVQYCEHKYIQACVRVNFSDFASVAKSAGGAGGVWPPSKAA